MTTIVTPFIWSGWGTAGQGPGAVIDLSALALWEWACPGFLIGGFSNVAPALPVQTFLCKMMFQTKHCYEPTAQSGENRSLFVLGGLWTLDDRHNHMDFIIPGVLPYGLPVPPGYNFAMAGNQLIHNGNSAGDHMIATAVGCMVSQQ